MCPISGCDMPWRRRPDKIAPPPIPVPMVRYRQFETPCAAPHLASPITAAFTSELKRTGMLNALCTAPAKLKFRHPDFVVEVMYPQAGDWGLISTGPKDPMQTPSRGACLRSHATAAVMVCSGVVVGISM